MIDEHAGELLADGFVEQNRGNRAVDAARQAAKYALVADLGADVGDLVRAEFGHRPVAGKSADLVDEIGQQLCPVRGVNHLGVKHRRVIVLRFVDADRERRVGRSADDLEPVGRLGEAEEVARGVVFLASDEAGFVTGSTLSMNGGQYMA